MRLSPLDRVPLLPALLALIALVAGTPLQAADPFAAELLAELNRARAERGLAALADDPALTEAGARRAAAMVAGGWFGLVSPDGRQIEDELDAVGYRFRLVTEKLVRSTAGAKALVDEWRLRPGDQAQSLFHPDVRRIGVGLAESAGGRIVDIVLATPMEEAASPAAADASAPSVTRAEMEPERAAFRELVAAERREAGLRALRVDPLLEQAAGEHATALLAALEKGHGVESIELLADRYAELEAKRSGGRNDLATSKDAFSVRETHATAHGKPVHDDLLSAIVVDARAAADALQSLRAAAARPLFLDPQMARLGVGIAVAPAGSGSRIVWVVATLRP